MFRVGAWRSRTVPKTAPGRGLAARSPFVAVGVAYVFLQLVTTNVRRAPSWDEAIYLSQVWRGAPALPFAPSRARGIALLVAPASWTSGSITMSRIFLMLAAGAMLAVAFAVWAPLIGRSSATAAAALFGGWWVSLYYGSAVMPNLWSALLGVTLTGGILRSVGSRRWLPWTCATGAAMALVRPPDAVVVFAVLALAAAASARPLRGRVLLWPGLGIALGSLAWLVEMSVRFNGPVAAVRDALTVGHVSAMSLPQRVLQQLAVSDGPTLGPVSHPTVPLLGALWWAVLAALAIRGLRLTRRSEARDATRVAGFVGLALIGVYVLLISGIAPRFLLPGVALLSLPAGCGGADAVLARGRTVRTGFAALFAVLLVWNAITAMLVSRDDSATQATARAAGIAVRDAADGRPCAVASTESYPEVAFAARCLGVPFGPGVDPSAALADWIAQGRVMFLVAHAPVAPALPGVSSVPVDRGVPTGWSVERISPLP